ncbi:hypothetical protein T440DRAFT_470664 [Plenodomus tracheiphilus IPT5]|uniref:BAH domain-containing protein n=1 Tax=Plenodomus tracheiphilus IPT5 TaxID=1408161 RepID=A0A6A7AXQ6_9PLEO|nr:hypothetical protein T440DRAFT_470664 [Plenodomus tracheiphilus IPT5]
MARKRKASELQAPSTDSAPAHERRTVDWSTIDQRKDFDGFKISIVKLKPNKETNKPVSKKRKTAKASRASEVYKAAPLGAEVSQDNPFPETDLSEVYCKIEPALEWESTQRYRKFTISGEAFEVNQFVLINKGKDSHDTPEAIEEWVAKVLEVRAGDTQHVYLRVYWAYRPEDLPGGRQPHHGKHELIVSNHMDIIDAQCVNDAASVIYWDDSPNQAEFPAPEQLYWRQAFDVNKKKGSLITKLNTYCVDKKPSNPDEPLLQCPSCSGYLHANCLEERALEDIHAERQTQQSKGSSKNQRAKKDSYETELSITDTNQPRLTVTKIQKGKKTEAWEINIHCLLCKALIAPANADAPNPETPAAQIVDDEEVEEEEADTTVTPEAGSPGAPLGEAHLAIGNIPTSATAASASSITTQAPRARGRPKGSKNKTRGRLPKVKIEEVVDDNDDVLSLDRQQEYEYGPERVKEELIAADDPISAAKDTAVCQITPPAPPPASVSQSVVRSVKRLLFIA